MDEIRKMGRPRKELSDKDWEQLEKLCALHCTAVECAAFFDMSIDTLERHIKERYSLSFPEYFQQKAANGKISLRRRQFEMAQTIPSLAIFLGKQWLGQSDKQEIQQQVTGTQTINITQENILDLIKQTSKDK
jgi:IS30 family transposase